MLDHDKSQRAVTFDIPMALTIDVTGIKVSSVVFFFFFLTLFGTGTVLETC